MIINPTHYYEDVFSSQQISETKDVLFVGSPFNLKGVDALIKSFNNIKDVYGLSLSLVGIDLKKMRIERGLYVMISELIL